MFVVVTADDNKTFQLQLGPSPMHGAPTDIPFTHGTRKHGTHVTHPECEPETGSSALGMFLRILR